MLIPENIKNFESNGEKILFQRFKNDPSTKEMIILHSLFTNNHLKNISGELDFLVLIPNEGIFAIEVKHGGVSRKDGTWLFENRFGEVTKKTKSPFAQVDGTMNSIRTWLLNKLEKDKPLKEKFIKFLWGSGVAFTSLESFADIGPEAHTWQIFTRKDFRVPISQYLLRLSKNWHNEHRNKYWYDANLSRPSSRDCNNLLRILRGDFSQSYDTINKINDTDFLIEEYTREQFSLLSFLDFNHRCLISGPAGTGKTLMGIEVFHRKIKNDKSVGFFCYNKRLGEKLSRTISRIDLPDIKNIFIGSLHNYLTSHCNEFSESVEHSFFSEVLPLEFLIQNEGMPESEKLDFLIIDEAQDLLTPNFIEVFDFILKGGLENGQWAFFGDFCSQNIFEQKSSEEMRKLSERVPFTRFPTLSINCRNSQKIVLQNTLVTGVEMPKVLNGNLPTERVITEFPAENDLCSEVESVIKKLISSGYPIEKITLLSPKRFENSAIKDSRQIKNYLSEGLEVATIHAFKGLENVAVILFDFDEITSDRAQKLLYVGISRARQKLAIVLKKELKKDYIALIGDNSKKLS